VLNPIWQAIIRKSFSEEEAGRIIRNWDKVGRLPEGSTRSMITYQAKTVLKMCKAKRLK
jgi:hypothetical protein